MKSLALLLAVAGGLAGCVVSPAYGPYVEPPGVYVAPPPVMVIPGRPHFRPHHHRGWGHRRYRGYDGWR
ncbi:MAG: hypothetical protein HY778_05705 [Betaproteobacteria bacterium]|nr:hypothetical protein [Betaproteobacteria bacterium]